jgi:glycosyltransferase involved in cell wall biosynthesis
MNREEQLEPFRLRSLKSDQAQAPRPRPTLLCLSHLRWGFVYQRPQHLMSRLASGYEVLFFEEPIFEGDAAPRLESHRAVDGVTILVPRLPVGMRERQAIRAQRELLDACLAEREVAELLLWYFTPMSLAFTGHLLGQVVIFDCMDELSAFRHAPPALVDMERRLMTRADVVFTVGHSLWEAKRRHHANIHAMPSSVDVAHFATARQSLPEPADQADIPRPRLGFFGVIDERFDIHLISELADQRPDWQIVLVGPVVKIDPASLPRLPNIHYLGGKSYSELPFYLSGWNVALMPFALNESTRFISPTKTPEYLAGGRPVVSTPIRDVVNGYGNSGVVSIATTPQGFIDAIETALELEPNRVAKLADKVLDGMSWDKTCAAIREKIECLR